MKYWGFFLSLVGAVGTASAGSGSLEKDIQKEAVRARTYLFANLSPADTKRGAVVASPSRDMPDYFYHWIRDAAVTMRELVELRATAPKSQKAGLTSKLFDYVSFERDIQLTPNRSGGLGEPKFLVSGEAFNDNWGRPQNDGPALRALTLTRFAEQLLAEGQKDLVTERLYRSELPAQTVIKADLEFVAKHWHDGSYDLWEEVKGRHVYTLSVQRASLIAGADLARELGDKTAAEYYLGEARKIERTFSDFEDRENGILRPTLDVEVTNVGPKESNLDLAIVLAALHGDGWGAFDSSLFFSSAEKLRQTFADIYPINGETPDLGTAIGRYPEDRYDGVGLSEANPWFLGAHAFAELECRLVEKARADGRLELNAGTRAFLGDLAPKGRSLTKDNVLFQTTLDAVHDHALGYLKRSLAHMGPDGHMSEQLDRSTGFQRGASDLTWSYASFLSAVRACGL